MRIGFDVAQTCVEKAGCGWYADSLIRAMVATAPEHDYFLYHQFGAWLNQETAAGTQIEHPQVRSTFANVGPQEAARIWRSPEELVIKAGTPDIVQANCFQAPAIKGALLIYTIYDLSFWASPEHSTEFNRLSCQKGVIDALRNADGFVFISHSAQLEFESILPGWLERNAKRWIVTPLAARHSPENIVARPAGRREGWLAVGSLEPRKNYDCLLTAMEIYWQKSTRRMPLRIAGGQGWKSESLRARIRDMEGPGLVEYLGYVPDEALMALYTEAYALIYPSWYEGFGLPIVEAMNSGCPVICSPNTSLREVGGLAPMYIDPHSPESVADAMLLLESSEHAWQARHAAALDRTALFSWPETARKTLEFYRELKLTHGRNGNSAHVH